MRASAAGSDDRTERRTAERASRDGIVAAAAIVVAPLAPGVVRTDTRSEQSRKAKGEWRVVLEEKGGGVFMEGRHEADQIMACFAAGVIYARR
jgi:hypothetical protein